MSEDPREFEAVIAVDLPCRFCGYNLRGLSRDVECPECGRPVRWTRLMLDDRDFAEPDPRWVRAADIVAHLLWLPIVLAGLGVVILSFWFPFILLAAAILAALVYWIAYA